VERPASFAPVVDARVRVLVLGSLPGVESLRRGQYYAHPRNAFWRLIGAVAGRDLAALPYPGRLEALLAARVGLWDVIAAAERRGSLDAAIRAPEHADLRALVTGLPELRAVGFNGRTAAKLGRRQLGVLPDGPALIDLPSSSPAHAAMPFAEKLARWSVLGEHLHPLQERSVR
jgi:hypoxanthine-DNA glycosylase